MNKIIFIQSIVKKSYTVSLQTATVYIKFTPIVTMMGESTESICECLIGKFDVYCYAVTSLYMANMTQT